MNPYLNAMKKCPNHLFTVEISGKQNPLLLVQLQYEYNKMFGRDDRLKTMDKFLD